MRGRRKRVVMIMKSSLLVLFFSFFFQYSSIFAAIPAHRCHPDDQRVLLQIKNHFHNSSLFSTWTPERDCCKWRIVSCKKIPKSTVYRVNFLEIDGADDLVGRIPSLVADLPYLETLIFRNLPNLTGPIPEAISKLTHLKLLFLNWNNLTGPVPDFLSRLPNIGSISLNDNRLSGPIPGSLGRLRNLKGLDLSNNNLTGGIPESFGAFAPGSEVTLSNNRLSGPIPRSLGRVNFEILEVAGNELTGDASFLFGENKTELAHLDLSRNRLSFDLTNVVMPVGELNSSLLVLDLSHNKIYGRLPAWLGRVPGLYQFNGSYNQLCGSIPTAGGKLQGFDQSSFGHNKCLCGAPLAPCKSSFV